MPVKKKSGKLIECTTYIYIYRNIDLRKSHFRKNSEYEACFEEISVLFNEKIPSIRKRKSKMLSLCISFELSFVNLCLISATCENSVRLLLFFRLRLLLPPSPPSRSLYTTSWTHSSDSKGKVSL